MHVLYIECTCTCICILTWLKSDNLNGLHVYIIVVGITSDWKRDFAETGTKCTHSITCTCIFVVYLYLCIIDPIVWYVLVHVHVSVC